MKRWTFEGSSQENEKKPLRLFTRKRRTLQHSSQRSIVWRTLGLILISIGWRPNLRPFWRTIEDFFFSESVFSVGVEPHDRTTYFIYYLTEDFVEFKVYFIFLIKYTLTRKGFPGTSKGVFNFFQIQNPVFISKKTLDGGFTEDQRIFQIS